MSVQLAGDWKFAKMALQQLPGLINRTAKSATLQTMDAAKTFLEEAYEGRGQAAAFVDSDFPAVGTLAKRRFGVGGRSATPTRKPSGSRRPLIETGGLVRALKLTPRTGGWELRIGGGVSHTGYPYERVAEIAEFGKTFVIDMTPRMRAFLILMYRNFGGSRVDTGTGMKKGKAGTILVHIPSRPVWKKLGEALHSGLVPPGMGSFPKLSWTSHFLREFIARMQIFKV